MRTYYQPGDEPLPAHAAVVWNGALDRAWADAQHRPAPQLTPDGPMRFVPGQAPPVPAQVDAGSRRPSDRVLTYLVMNRHAEHTSRSLAAALALPQPDAGVYLKRFAQRGVLVLVHIPRHLRDLRVYRVRPVAEVL